MPIRFENRARYPDDWKAISRRLRDEHPQCQKCGAPNGALIRRGRAPCGEDVWRLAGDSAHFDGRSAETGDAIEDSCADLVGYGRPVRVVLTVAHLDHTPENCDPSNLRVWCQRCHNRYDAPMRRAGIKARARDACAVGDFLS